MTRVAVVDIGSNTTRLLIADVDGGQLEEVARETAITRLAEGVDASGRLAAVAVERTLAALARFADLAAGHGAERSLAIATSAVRSAANPEDLVDAAAQLGFAVRVLSGTDEAALGLAGALSCDPHPPAGTVVLDVGGGSTELALAGAGVVPAWSCSLPLGSVRLSERMLGEDVVEQSARERCRSVIAGALASVPQAVPVAATRVVAVAGTPTTLAALDLGLDVYDAGRVHGHVLGRSAIAGWEERLCAMTLAQRLALPALEAGRAPVICAGVLILAGALDRLGIAELTVSDRDTLHGAALGVSSGGPPGWWNGKTRPA